MQIDQAVAKKAYDVITRYIAAINAHNAEAVRDTLNFPHFRIGLDGNCIYYPEPSLDHLAVFRNRTNDDGWHHSVVDDMQAIFTFPSKAHVTINFRRLRADGSEIGSYHSLYIVTQKDGHWGIQGGSGTGL